MRIYAIRDRLIDYFMQPFVGPDDKNVLASVARLVNQGEITSDITQAPHHFEVWQLGEVQEDGTVVAHKELLADCASLVRDVRNRTDAGANKTHGLENGSYRPPRSAGGATGTDTGPLPGPTPTAPAAS